MNWRMMRTLRIPTLTTSSHLFFQWVRPSRPSIKVSTTLKGSIHAKSNAIVRGYGSSSPKATTESTENDVLLRNNVPLCNDGKHENPFCTELTLNIPKRFNPLSLQVLYRLKEELILADQAYPQCRCVVIKASPGKAFCAGHDMKEINTSLPNKANGVESNTIRELFTTCSEVMQAFRNIRPVTIASVHGIATAAGCQLVAAVDLALATESSRFALSGIHNGLVCSTPIVAVSRSVRYPKHALEMLLTGDFISAQEAKQFGLLNQVVVAGENEEEEDYEALQRATTKLVHRITRHSGYAVARGKQLFYQQYDMNLTEAYTLATQRIVDDIVDSADAFEGISAFVEKRPPQWKFLKKCTRTKSMRVLLCILQVRRHSPHSTCA